MKKMNFGRNVQIDSKLYFEPKTEAEVLEILNQHKGRSIRCMGRLHSWSQVLDSPDILLDLRNLDRVQPNPGQVVSVDVGAGCQIKRLLAELEQQDTVDSALSRVHHRADHSRGHFHWHAWIRSAFSVALRDRRPRR